MFTPAWDRLEPIFKEFGFKKEELKADSKGVKGVRGIAPNLGEEGGNIYAAWSKGDATIFVVTGINIVDWHKTLNNPYLVMASREARYSHLDFVLPFSSSPAQEVFVALYSAVKMMVQYAVEFYDREDMKEEV